MSRRHSLLLFVVMAAPSLYIVWTLARMLHKLNMTNSIWSTFLPFFVIILVSPIVNYIQLCLFTTRRTAIIENGVVEFRRFMRRRRHTTDDAFCFIHAQKHLTRIEWYENGKQRPAHALYFRDPDDPRIQTILNLWTADPIANQ